MIDKQYKITVVKYKGFQWFKTFLAFPIAEFLCKFGFEADGLSEAGFLRILEGDLN